MNILLGFILVFIGVIVGMTLMTLTTASKISEMQSLIDASRKSLANAEERVKERNKLIKIQSEDIKTLKNKIVDLENNIEFLFNNLSAQKKKLVIDGKSKN